MTGLPWKDPGHFRFAWPWALLLLALIPIGWAVYARYCKRRVRETALRFSYAAVAAQLRVGSQRGRRLLFPVAVSLLFAALVASLARPLITARVPVRSADIMIVLDISLSMLADDIRPSRLEAAKKAAIDFVRELPPDMRVGLEAFAGDAYLLAAPTRRHDEVIADLDALRPEDLRPRTEIGTALHEALRTLNRATRITNATGKTPAPPGGSKPEPLSAPVAPHRPDRAIVLLSDGDSHEGYPWDRAAEDAKRDGVVIHSIGIGSLEGDTIFYRGMELPVLFDETTLRRIASITDGRYFRILKESDFREAYRRIQARTVHYEEKDIDLSFIAAAFGILVLIAALSLA